MTVAFFSSKRSVVISVFNRVITLLIVLTIPAWALAANTASVSPVALGLDDEIRSVQQALVKQPDTYQLQLHLGFLKIKSGDFDSALHAFGEALRLKPRSHDALCGQGIIYGRKGDFEKARKLLEDALVLNPNPVRTHYELGVLFEQHGDIDLARAEYRKGLTKYQEGRR